VPFK